MNELQVIEKINQMDGFDKLDIWNHYHATQLSLKHNFHVVIKGDEEDKAWGIPENDMKYSKTYSLWKDINITPYEAFCSEKNIINIDNGENWKENGKAQRNRLEITGVYGWYYKNQEIFN